MLYRIAAAFCALLLALYQDNITAMVINSQTTAQFQGPEEGYAEDIC